MTLTAAPSGPRVVVGVDGSQSSVRAAVYAAEEARRRGLPLQVVHVTPWRAGDELAPMAAPEVREEFERSAARLVAAAADAVRAETGFPDVVPTVMDDHPVDGLLALSDEATVLVIGTRGASGVAGVLLGSTAGAVIQHARCPVIALPDEQVADAGRRLPVVAGVDGLPGQEEVLDFAVAAATGRGTALVVLHAWRDTVLEAALGQYGALVDWEGVEAEKRKNLGELVAPWRARNPDLDIREVVVRDRPASALRDAGEEAALLVVGHRPRGLFARLGSTTHGVLHRAGCPVAVVPLHPGG